MKSDEALTVLTPDATLAQIITADQKAAELLASIGLNLSSNEDKTLREVCSQKKWNEEEVMKWIKKSKALYRVNAENNTDEEKNIFAHNLPKLYDYLEQEHQPVILNLLSEIGDNFPTVFKIHGNQYTWLKNVHLNFGALNEILRLSLEFRKEKVFPLMREVKDQKNEILDGTLKMLSKSIEVIRSDQQKITRQLAAIMKMSNGFAIPEGACTTLRILIHNFKTLNSELKKQFRLEKAFIIPAMQTIVQ